MQWIKWKHESTKWLAKFMRLCAESLHVLSFDQCRIAHERVASRIKVEDHYSLLVQVKTLFSQVVINNRNVLHQCKHRLRYLSTETLRGIAYQLLADLNVDSHIAPFHADAIKNCKRPWRELTPAIILRRDLAAKKRHHCSQVSKRRRETFEDMVESHAHKRRRDWHPSKQRYHDVMLHEPGARVIKHISIEHACCVSSILRQKQHTLGKHTDGVINNIIGIMHAAVHWSSMHSDNSSLTHDDVMV